MYPVQQSKDFTLRSNDGGFQLLIFENLLLSNNDVMVLNESKSLINALLMSTQHRILKVMKF